MRRVLRPLPLVLGLVALGGPGRADTLTAPPTIVFVQVNPVVNPAPNPYLVQTFREIWINVFLLKFPDWFPLP